MEFILSKKIKKYTKDIIRFISIMLIALFIIVGIFLANYKTVYKVTISGQEVGYVKNIEEFKEKIQNDIINNTSENVAYVTLDVEPQYETKLLNNSQATNEDQIIEDLKRMSVSTYKIYAINYEDTKTYVNSLDEANEVVDELKSEYESNIDFDISIVEEYTDDLSTVGTEELANAKAEIDSSLRSKVEEKEEIEKHTVNGVYLAVTPVSGNITSRYGSQESIRSSSHKGLDIATRTGTPIYAAASGTVVKAEVYGGYGNLVIIDHGNGVQTYYGHCSKLLVTAGQTVEAGENIALVGSTGFSTGSHLHFEVRINGVTTNPQNYLYN